jgi:hypothetical protein
MKFIFIVLAVFVSAIVWAVANQGLYWGYGSPLDSLNIAAVGGIITFLIFLIFGKSWNRIPFIVGTILVSAAGAFAFLYLSDFFSEPPQIAEVVVFCGETGKKGVLPDKIKVKKGGTVKWYFVGREGTVVHITFSKNFQPFGIPSYDATIPSIVSLEVKNKGRDKYKFSCGSSNEDPMIHVPK